MFTILNRFRGTKGYWAHISGIIFGIIFGIATGSWQIGLAVAIMYVFGESFGWGKWIGGIMHGQKGPATEHQIADEEGRRNGIHFLASLIVPETKNYYNYCVTALGIRGFYWFALAFLPLAIAGAVSWPIYLLSAAFMGIAFPVGVMIGKKTSEIFNYEFGFFKMNGTWEHQEVWYGLALDVLIVILIIII